MNDAIVQYREAADLFGMKVLVSEHVKEGEAIAWGGDHMLTISQEDWERALRGERVPVRQVDVVLLRQALCP